jgi:hypothetical protein
LKATGEHAANAMGHRYHAHPVTQWLLLLAPLVAAFIQQQVLYESVPFACRGETLLAVHLPTLVAALVAIGTSSVSWRTLRRAGLRQPGDERSDGAIARFTAMLALAAGGFAFLLILAQWMPSLFIDPCQR